MQAGPASIDRRRGLRRLGCGTVQGFHVGRPLPADLAFAAIGTAAVGMLTGQR
ncbi:MAG TPA: hypothetical protein VG276_18545 [Actinomycetes bacterium]|nr:hypothetical protein [Actinomycetes bacterium]